uniref:Uncharacterized protein n=1 Tax=Nelumbo nucifera TaxID=4432 RepID=A0A822XPH6_NELNU|nr:TPA_asm: hypothetical protein HUJ06_022279 [Nelumbo nucifera]DAD20818.1 TPA_asm: hypothetical protein HUJ06_022281 [Nelumbo nucifera]
MSKRYLERLQHNQKKPKLFLTQMETKQEERNDLNKDEVGRGRKSLLLFDAESRKKMNRKKGVAGGERRRNSRHSRWREKEAG